MRGILSSAPAPSAIRLLVGSQMLLLVQAGLVLSSWRPLHAPIAILIFLVAVVGMAALVAATLGEPADAPPARRRPHHER